MSAGIEAQHGSFAAEGTAAHALAAACLVEEHDAAYYADRVVDSVTGSIRADKTEDGERYFDVTDEMIDAVQTYLDLCRRFMKAPWEHDVEQRLDLRVVHKDVFGTGDFISYHPGTKALVVIDFKYGKGVPVEVEDNEQLLTYALGAALRYHNRGLGSIDLYVVQPRCPHPAGPERHAGYDSVDLLEFRAKLAAAAKATEVPDAPLLAGDHCKFCPASAVCPTFREKATALAESEFSASEVSGLSAEKLGEILNQAGLLKDWIKRVEAYAQTEAQHGRLPTGFKLVAKRATRKWKDPEGARTFMVTALELDEADVLVEPKLKSPAQIEALIGKKRHKEIGGLWESVSSGANLVPVSDPRPELKPDAEKEFAE